MEKNEPDRLIRLSEACRMLGITPETGRVWIKDKTAPMDKARQNPKGYWMIPVSVVVAMVGE